MAEMLFEMAKATFALALVVVLAAFIASVIVATGVTLIGYVREKLHGREGPDKKE